MTNAEITHATVHGEPTANNAFIGAQAKLREAIAELQAISDDCMRRERDVQRDWADACEAVDMVNRVVDAANRFNGHVG